MDRDGWGDDGAPCRLCGVWTSMPAIHHIEYRSAGGLDIPSNMLTLAQEFDRHDCHLQRAHGPEAAVWREAFQGILAERTFMTAIQWRRWAGSPLRSAP